MHTTYFIRYIPHTQHNLTNTLHVWLSRRHPCIYIRESSWFVVAVASAAALRDELLVLIDAEDELMVFAVGPEWSTWGGEDLVKSWIKENWYPGLTMAK